MLRSMLPAPTSHWKVRWTCDCSPGPMEPVTLRSGYRSNATPADPTQLPGPPPSGAHHPKLSVNLCR